MNQYEISRRQVLAGLLGVAGRLALGRVTVSPLRAPRGFIPSNDCGGFLVPPEIADILLAEWRTSALQRWQTVIIPEPATASIFVSQELLDDFAFSRDLREQMASHFSQYLAEYIDELFNEAMTGS